MKILYVITDLHMGGAEIQVLRLCKYMSKDKNNNLFLVSMMSPESKDMMDELISYGVQVFSLNMKRGKASTRAYTKFISIVRNVRPDIIHTHMIHANILSRLARPLIGKIKIINTIHGEEEYLGKRIKIYKATDLWSDYTVACGKILYNEAKKFKICKPNKLRYICNGLDLKEYSFDQTARKKIRNQFNISEDTFLWITVGRLGEVKNQKYLITEFAKVCTIFSQVKLMIVGDGPLEEKLKELVLRMNLQGKVIFTGKRNDVDKLLSSADAFVLSSIHEGLPLSMQEAAAEELPLVSTNVGGCNEVVEDGLNGYLCESNGENELSKAMCKLMGHNRDELIRMRKKSRMIAEEKFDILTTVKYWNKLYK